MRRRRLEVVPDSDRVDQRLVEAAEATGFVDARAFCTWSQLVEACEPLRWAKRAPAAPLLVRALIAEHAVGAARAFGPHARSAEFAAHAQVLLGQLRAQGVTSRQLAQAGQQASGALSERVQALAELWRRVDAALEERELVDPSGVLGKATERLQAEGLPPRLADVAAIAVRFVHELFPARLAFLEALARACHAAGVDFELAWPASGEATTDLLVLDAIRQVEAKWQGLNAEAFPEVPEAPLAWLGAAAFTTAAAARPAPELERFSAATQRDEAQEIARRVKRLLAGGAPPESIAVLFRDLAQDTERLVEALAEVGVPARARLGIPLSASPVGRLALGLIDLVEDDFPADAVATCLESRYVQVGQGAGVDPRRVFSAAGVKDDVIGATSQAGGWKVRLEAHQARVQRNDPPGAKAVGRVSEAVQQLLAVARGIPAQGPALELLEAFWEAVTRLRLLEEHDGPGPLGAGLLGREVDRAIARDQSSREALAALLADLKASLRESALGRRVWSRRELGRWLKAAAGEVNLLARGPRAGAVWLLDAREVAGRSFLHVFVGGMVDGRFPGRANPAPLVSEAERAQLNQLASMPLFRLGVADGEHRLPLRLAEDRLLFHLALSCAQRSVTLSRSRLEDGGRELLASPFLDAVHLHVTGVDEVTLARRAVPTLDEVATETELRARASLEVLGPPGTRQTVPDPRRGALAEALRAEPWLVEARALTDAEVERLRYFSDATRPEGPWSGLVAPDAVLLDRLTFGPERPLSAAEIDVWGRCAFRGLGQHVLGLRPDQESGEEPDNLTLGTFLHGAMERVVPALIEAGLWGRDGVDRAALETHVKEAVRAAGLKADLRMATGHPELWELSQEQTARQMVRLLSEAETVRPFGSTQVHAIELRFGDRHSPPDLQQVMLPAALEGERDVYLKGRLDRVDTLTRGLGVVDYKKGRLERAEAAAELLVSNFQLPFYAWALRQAADPGAAVEAAWVLFKKGQTLSLRDVLEARDGDLTGLLAADAVSRRQLAEAKAPNLANAVHGLLGRLRAGAFGARASSCEYCDLKPVCRISSRIIPELKR